VSKELPAVYRYYFHFLAQDVPVEEVVARAYCGGVTLQYRFSAQTNLSDPIASTDDFSVVFDLTYRPVYATVLPSP